MRHGDMHTWPCDNRRKRETCVRGHVITGERGRHSYIGLARTIYIRCIYGNSGREITKYTVQIYGSGQIYSYVAV